MGRLAIHRLAGPPTALKVDGRPLAESCYVASTVLSRFVGLLATPDLAAHEALWIERCSSVHTVGLRAAIGVAFLDADGYVMRVVDPLPRNRTTGVRGARSAVECRAGLLASLVPGARLVRE